jgi:hypothetical protein
METMTQRTIERVITDAYQGKAEIGIDERLLDEGQAGRSRGWDLRFNGAIAP